MLLIIPHLLECMKKLALIMVCLLSSTHLFAQSPTQQTTQVAEDLSAPIQINLRPEITGLWGMVIPENRQCVEYYNFRSNSELVIKSDKEWSIGKYQYQVPNNRSEQAPALVMHILYDNNEKDCSGYQEDQTGEVQQMFVKWINPQQIAFCHTDKGEQCFATLNKQLP